MLWIAFVKIKANEEEGIINMYPLSMLFCRESFSCRKEWPGRTPGM